MNAMTKQFRSKVMASIHKTADGLRAAGVMDQQTMWRFDKVCLTPVRAQPPVESEDRMVSI
jgi:putative transcriptional regulator